MQGTGHEYYVAECTAFTHRNVMRVCCQGDEELVIEFCMSIGEFCTMSKLCLPHEAGTSEHAMAALTQRVRHQPERSWRHHFSASRLPMGKLVQLLFYFASGTGASKTRQFVGVSTKAVTEWFDIYRGICSKEMLTVDMSVGGPGHVVEIDETSLAKKQKYARGKKYPDFCVFGAFDRVTKKWVAAITFDDRSKPTLTLKIAEMIKPRTHIISDKFGSYVSANEKHTLETNPAPKHMGFTHTWVNYSKNFVNPTAGAHTNGIEGCWEAKLKSRIKAMRGTITAEQVASIVDECL
ncbi:TPA: LOW QUALITY PROTEIN: hypothetical protein N0F65_003030 [Lagenidium giganteum]|uniref:ISXO2-like transposase domain-containing protein n=1 Tax=Lagenidium giganteum TaxID=4803 RepID=A0AAV2YYD3_9STRA|nr:TPA: LOW QUALITY PROTEIN: hypothetical protein N0F65_003030 [Lagenidium giganteum]